MRRKNLFAGNPFGVTKHHQQMPPIQRGNVIIAHARMIGQHERIGDPKKLPRDKTLSLAPLQSEHIHHALMKNLRAYQPPPSRRPSLGLHLAAKEFLVIDIIAITRITQLFLQLRSAMLP